MVPDAKLKNTSWHLIEDSRIRFSSFNAALNLKGIKLKNLHRTKLIGAGIAAGRVATLAALAMLTSVNASASGLDNLSTLSQDQFTKLSKDLGAAAAYRGVTPGNSLGITGFDIGIELTESKIENSSSLKRAGGGDTSTLFIPKLHIHKGLPAGFDIGAFVSRISGVNASLIGAEVRYQIIEDGLTTPSVALRLSGSKATGISQVNLSTVAVDAMISKKLAFITPYAGIGSVRIASAPKIGLLHDVTATDSRVFVGVNMNFLTTNLALEAEKLGGVSSVSGKIGFRF